MEHPVTCLSTMACVYTTKLESVCFLYLRDSFMFGSFSYNSFTITKQVIVKQVQVEVMSSQLQSGFNQAYLFLPWFRVTSLSTQRQELGYE